MSPEIEKLPRRIQDGHRAGGMLKAAGCREIYVF